MKQAWIVTHTHWDREWRYPLWENRLYLSDMMDELLQILDTQPDYAGFLMDGQTVMVEDYLAMHPQNIEKVKRYIKEGRIDVGPWYTLPDLYPVCGESLVRNLLRGKRSAAELGRRLNVAHESFGWGQTAQLPQIYHEFGLDFVVVAKNVSQSRCPNCEFIWEAPDGTQVLATRLGEHARANFFMNAYLNITTGKDYNSDEYFMKLGQDGQVFHEADRQGFWEDYFVIQAQPSLHEERIASSIDRAWSAMDATLLPQKRLLMNGSDSSTAQPELTQIIQKAQAVHPELELHLGMLENYVRLFEKEVDRSQLHILRGELRDGPACKCSANALSTRPRLKMLNKRAENALFRMAEPLCMMANINLQSFLDTGLTYLLLSHPHDSINGVTQDKTAEDTMFRLNQALEIGEAVSNEACKHLLRHMNFSAYQDDEVLLVLFNTLPTTRSQVLHTYIDFPQAWNVWDFDVLDGDRVLPKAVLSRKEVVTPVANLHSRPLPYEVDRYEVLIYAEQIPAMGYQTLHIRKTKAFHRKTIFWPEMRRMDGTELATAVNAMENEYLSVTVNGNGTCSITHKESGETYSQLNYIEETGDHGDYWIYYPPYHNQTHTSLGVQASIWQEENTALSATIGVRYELCIPAYGLCNEHSVQGDSRRSDETVSMPVTCYYTLEKGARGLKVRTVIQNTARDHRVRVGFDTGIAAQEACSAGHFTIDKRPTVNEGAFDPEMQTLPKQNFVSLRSGSRGFAVLDDCTCEYEAAPSGQLFLTLLRGVRNIICTEFRSAGIFAHENGGQSMGTLTYDYLLMPFLGGEAQLLDEAECFRTQPKAVQTSKGMGQMPDRRSLFELPKPLVLSAFKKSEDGHGEILRVYNPTAQAVTAPLPDYLIGALRVRMDEEPMGDCTALHVAPYQILTLRISHRNEGKDAE
ncbi:MAG: glycoside hydrolase family 38 C-terminal domain-containing protein [Clostridia bacterium]